MRQARVIPSSAFSRNLSFVIFTMIKFTRVIEIEMIEGIIRPTEGTNWLFETGRP